MSLFTVDRNKCKDDGICAAECPLQIIEMKDSAPTPAADAEERCIQCGHCVAVCAHDAFDHSMLKTAEWPPVREDFALTTGQAEYFMRSRRSIRTYRDKAVEREKLKKLIDIARYAPTGTNSQQVHWQVVGSREGVMKLGGLAVDMIRHMVKANNPFVLKYRLANAVTRWEAGIDTITRGAPALVIAHAPKAYGLSQVDCTSALAYLDLAVPTLGLGSCWAGYLMIAAAQWPPFHKALALPEGHSSFGIMMIGYPKFKYHRLPPRNEPVVTWTD